MADFRYIEQQLSIPPRDITIGCDFSLPSHNAPGAYGRAMEAIAALIVTMCQEYGGWTGVTIDGLKARVKLEHEKAQNNPALTTFKDRPYDTEGLGLAQLLQRGMIDIRHIDDVATLLPTEKLLDPIRQPGK